MNGFVSNGARAWWLGACGVLGVVASFLPWAAEYRWGQRVPLWGMHWGGQLTALAGLFIVLCAAVLLRVPGARTRRVMAALAGVAALAVLATLFASVGGLVFSGVPDSRVLPDLGAPLLLVGAAGACALASSLVGVGVSHHGRR